MAKLDLKKLKSGGFIKEAQQELFALRIRIPVGDIDADKLDAIAKVSKKYGSGNLHFTVRQGIEINDVKFEDFEKATDELKKAGLVLGACGARVRVVTACPGSSVCPKGLKNTKSLGLKLDEEYFGRSVPHKFKMALTGCPNACAKPQENDLGFMAVTEPLLDEEVAACISCGLCEKECYSGAIQMVEGKPQINLEKCISDGTCLQVCPTGSIVAKRSGWNIFVGGRFGKSPKLGSLFKEFLSSNEAFDITDKLIKVFQKEGTSGQRFGVFIEKIGLERLEELVNNES
jgi:anaerobic sulfite reductase subunit C